ncbi:MAG: transposase [Planctomycetota bacterium]
MSLPRHLPPAEPDPVLLALFDQPERIPLAIRRQAEFFVFFARTIFPLLERYRDRLGTVYCADNGRPAWDPVRLLGVLILQFVLRLPDRQAAESAQYDQRWRLALHLGAQDATFDPSLLVSFRDRLVDGAQAGLAFEAVLDFLVEQGWVPRRSRQRLDSTHVRGLLSAMNRLECARETIRLLLKDIEAAGILPADWAGYWDRYVESKLDPRCGAPALEAKAAQAGEDMLAIWKDAAECWTIVQRDAFVLLQRVFLENYAMDTAGYACKTRAQPTGAVHNPHEPEAQWSSKSTTKDKTWVGYKVRVAETAQEQPRQPGEPTANFLTAMVTQNAPASDKPGMAQALGEQKAMGLKAPSALYVDGAYVCSDSLNEALEQGRELRGPAPAPPDRGKVFTVEAFDVHVEDRYAICPSGQHSGNCSRLEEQSTGNVHYRIEWSKTVCANCSLRDSCVSSGQDHRTIAVGELHSLLQDRRREMQTEAFKQEMRRRNGIEGTQSELVRGYGLRQARYRGYAKVRLQNYLIGAACNIRRLFRRLAWAALQARSVDAVGLPAIAG